MSLGRAGLGAAGPPIQGVLLLGEFCSSCNEKMQWGAGYQSPGDSVQFLSPLPHFSAQWFSYNPVPFCIQKTQRDCSATGPAPTGIKEGQGMEEGQVGGAGLIPKGPVPNPD